jgi:signal transduction histidine kinase
MADLPTLEDDPVRAVEALLGPGALQPGLGLVGTLLGAVNTAACLIDADDRVVGWNAKHEEFLGEHNGFIRRGLPYAEILENYFRHNSSETDGERRRVILAEALRRHREMVEPSMFQKKDGRWLLSQLFRLPGGWALKIWTDKTRELNQTAVTESSELSSLSDCAIISFDRTGAFRAANNRAGDLFPDAVQHFHAGCRFEREMLDCIRHTIEAGELDKVAPLFERTWPPHGEALTRPVVLRRRDGGWLQLEERVLLDGSLSMIWIDITKLLALEATNAELDSLVTRLRAAQVQAEAASHAKSQFLAVMSHELRTPMTGVIGMIDVLRKTALDARQTEYLEVMRQSADTLLAVLNDILDFSKIEAGQLEIETVAFDLDAVIDGVVRLFAPRAAEKGLALGCSWPADAPRRVHGDPVRLRQVLANLVGNAVKFTAHGRIDVRLAHWQVDEDRVRLRLEVADTGPGIDEAVRPRLFQMFSQGDSSTNRRFGGTGLGLAICRRLIEAMGGAIGVDAPPAGGAAFWFEIALAVAPAAPARDGAPQRAEPASDPRPPRAARVLVAEDVPTNRRLVEAILAHLGHEVAFVENGRDAVDAVRRERFDIVLMDMQMPEMDGIEATRAIRALAGPAAATPILALTADVVPEQRRRFEAAGIDGVLLKPIQWGELQKAITAALR